MSETITFYHNPMSRGRIVHWMLEEAEAPYEVKLISFEKREHKSPEYLAINPMGKLPAIVHRGTVITETPAILAYLADAFPANHLAPALDDVQRGAYLRWMFFGASCLEAAMMDKMLGRPPAERSSAIGYGTYEDTMGVIDNAVKDGPFLLGDHFTAADLLISSQLGFGIMTKAIDPTPAIAAYVGRATDRPAHKRALAANQT